MPGSYTPPVVAGGGGATEPDPTNCTLETGMEVYAGQTPEWYAEAFSIQLAGIVHKPEDIDGSNGYLTLPAEARPATGKVYRLLVLLYDETTFEYQWGRTEIADDGVLFAYTVEGDDLVTANGGRVYLDTIRFPADFS